MLRKYLKEFDKFLIIAGLKDVKIDDAEALFTQIRRAPRIQIQIFDANCVASQQHLYFATLNALKAFQYKLNISSSLAVEALLYASGQRQIQKSVDMLGVKPKTHNATVLIITDNEDDAIETLNRVSKTLDGKFDDSVMEVTAEKYAYLKRLFGISDREIEAKTERKNTEKEALIYLIIERGALLPVTK